MRVIVGLLVASTAVAHAQPGSEPAPPPADDPGAPAPPPEAPPPPPPMPAPIPQPLVQEVVDPLAHIEKGILEDANAGRAWISPTALSDPAGTWSFSDFELFVISAGYAVSDQFSVSATTLLPLVEGQPFFGVLSGKYQFLKSGRLRMAAQAALMYGGTESTVYDSNGNSTSETQGVVVADVGAVATLCLDDECHSHIGGFLAAGFAREDQSAVPFLVSASAVGRLSTHLKAVVEIDSAFIAGDINDTSDGFLLWYGVRFTSRQIGVDLGFLKPFVGDGDDPLILGLPFISFTYRAL